MLLLDTGVRAGELVSLKVSDVDLRAREVKAFGKDQEERLIPLEDGALRALVAYLSTREQTKLDDPLFPSGRGPDCFLTKWGLLRLIKRLAERANLEENAYPHLLRHTFAKKWLRGPGEGDMEALRELMGHASIETTRIYAAYKTEDIKVMHKDRSPVNQILQRRTWQLAFWPEAA